MNQRKKLLCLLPILFLVIVTLSVLQFPSVKAEEAFWFKIRYDNMPLEGRI